MPDPILLFVYLSIGFLIAVHVLQILTGMVSPPKERNSHPEHTVPLLTALIGVAIIESLWPLKLIMILFISIGAIDALFGTVWMVRGLTGMLKSMDDLSEKAGSEPTIDITKVNRAQRALEGSMSDAEQGRTSRPFLLWRGLAQTLIGLGIAAYATARAPDPYPVPLTSTEAGALTAVFLIAGILLIRARIRRISNRKSDTEEITKP